MSPRLTNVTRTPRLTKPVTSSWVYAHTPLNVSVVKRTCTNCSSQIQARASSPVHSGGNSYPQNLRAPPQWPPYSIAKSPVVKALYSVIINDKRKMLHTFRKRADDNPQVTMKPC